jgi:hypothetical protein
VSHPLIIFEVMFQLVDPLVKLARIYYTVIALVVLLDEFNFRNIQTVSLVVVPFEFVDDDVDWFN